jgi:hypothetical protein
MFEKNTLSCLVFEWHQYYQERILQSKDLTVSGKREKHRHHRLWSLYSHIFLQKKLFERKSIPVEKKTNILHKTLSFSHWSITCGRSSQRWGWNVFFIKKTVTLQVKESLTLVFVVSSSLSYSTLRVSRLHVMDVLPVFSSSSSSWLRFFYDVFPRRVGDASSSVDEAMKEAFFQSSITSKRKSNVL